MQEVAAADLAVADPRREDQRVVGTVGLADDAFVAEVLEDAGDAAQGSRP